MKYTLYIASVVFAAFFLISCYPFNISLKPEQNSLNVTFTISGTITKNDGGNAVGASVQLKQDGVSVGTAVTTDGSGVYTIINVAPGIYTIEVSLTGYETGAIPAFTVSGADVTGKNLMLKKTLSLNLGAYTGTYTVDIDGTTIKSITTDAGEILIGRPVTDTVTLNIQSDGSLAFRPAESGYIPIGAYAEFQLINTDAASLADDYRQEADLDLMSEEWTPIGNDATLFTGTFDGDGKDIDNLFIDDDNADNQGLFGVVTGTVEDVHIRSGSVTGKSWVAGVVGRLGIGNQYDTDTTPKTVRLCSNAANITGDTDVGGIVGCIPAYAGVGSYTGEAGTIISCYNTGDIKGTTAVGGVIGYLSTAKTIACYNTGDVTGLQDQSQGVGGVAGINNYGNVIACYNTGVVSGKGEHENSNDPNIAGVGGVVGCMWIGWGHLTACYNTGNIITTSGSGTNVGAVVGYNTGSGTQISANYWKSGTAARGVGFGGGTVAEFSSTDWPTTGTHTEWGAGDGSGSGKYWKSLGGWNGGSPIYPKLWFE